MKSWSLERPAGVIAMTPASPSSGAAGMVKVAVVPVVLMVTSAAGTVTPPRRKATRIWVSAGAKLVPVRVTGVPPVVGPVLGVRLVVVGSGGGGGAT